MRASLSSRVITLRSAICLSLAVLERWGCIVSGLNVRIGSRHLRFLDLVVSHLQAKLVNPTLDSIPASKSRCEVHTSNFY